MGGLNALETVVVAATAFNALALAGLALFGGPRRLVTRCIELTDRLQGFHSRLDRIEAQRASFAVEHAKMIDELETFLENIERKRNAASTAATRLEQKEARNAPMEANQVGTREAAVAAARAHFYGH